MIGQLEAKWKHLKSVRGAETEAVGDRIFDVTAFFSIIYLPVAEGRIPRRRALGYVAKVGVGGSNPLARSKNFYEDQTSKNAMQSVFSAASWRTISTERLRKEGPRRCAKNGLD